MNKTSIDSTLFKELIQYGYSNLKANAKIVDELNVFPIPDGDTGENMCMTFLGGVQAIKSAETNSIEEISTILAKGMLLSARGNSGVILSQLFYGISLGLQGFESVGLAEFGAALQKGVSQAYTAVLEPVEGTILTVARESVEYAQKSISEETTLEGFIYNLLEQTNKSVQETPEKLPILKESGVVDSGGAGLLFIIEGFNKCLTGQTIDSEELAVTEDKSELDFSKFNENSVLEFGYCTEVLLQLQKSKVDVDSFNLDTIKDFLTTIGDSIVTVQTGYIVKIHVHTFTPYKVLEFCQSFGEFLKIKIENMTLQHNEAVVKNRFEFKPQKRTERKKFGLVTVASGEGIKTLFEGFGADVVINGGQTNNPSTEDFVKAFEEANAENIFVLPNNSNIILAAQQAAKLYKAASVYVIETKSIGDGYAAMSMLNYGLDDAVAIAESMKNEISSTVTGCITKAIRTTQCNEIAISCDDYIGFAGKQMLIATPTRIKTVLGLLDKLGIENKDCLVVIYGKSVAEKEKNLVRTYVEEKFKNIEIYEIEGQQEIYDYYLILQ